MKKLNNHDFTIILRQGTFVNLNTAVTKNTTYEGEPLWVTDDEELYVGNGTENVRANRAKYSDYSLTQTGNLPTTQAKMNFSGATLINESQDLFDATNSRILKLADDDVVMCSISVELDTSSGTSHWIEFQAKAYDDTGTLLFSKRPITRALVKNNANDAAHEMIDFYFGNDVEYFEIWWRGSSAMPYTDPAITVIKL